MTNKKASQRDRVIYELGLLLRPIEEFVKSDLQKNRSDLRVAIARAEVGYSAWRKSVRELCTFPGNIIFNEEKNTISRIPGSLIHGLNRLADKTDLKVINAIKDLFDIPKSDPEPQNLKEEALELYEECVNKALKNIDKIPIEWKPEIFPANTPFTAYTKIREAVVVCSKKFHYFDRYLKPDFFRLFVAEIPRSVELRIITTAGNSNFGFKAVEDISNLIRKEYVDYALVEVNPALMHDRNLRIDDTIFSLGPGVDRAGVAVTNFGPSDSSNKAHSELDQIINKGTVLHHS